MFFGTELHPISEKHAEYSGHHEYGQWNTVLTIEEELYMLWLIDHAKNVNEETTYNFTDRLYMITGAKLETDWSVSPIWMEVNSNRANGNEKMLPVS